MWSARWSTRSSTCTGHRRTRWSAVWRSAKRRYSSASRCPARPPSSSAGRWPSGGRRRWPDRRGRGARGDRREQRRPRGRPAPRHPAARHPDLRPTTAGARARPADAARRGRPGGVPGPVHRIPARGDARPGRHRPDCSATSPGPATRKSRRSPGGPAPSCSPSSCSPSSSCSSAGGAANRRTPNPTTLNPTTARPHAAKSQSALDGHLTKGADPAHAQLPAGRGHRPAARRHRTVPGLQPRPLGAGPGVHRRRLAAPGHRIGQLVQSDQPVFGVHRRVACGHRGRAADLLPPRLGPDHPRLRPHPAAQPRRTAHRGHPAGRTPGLAASHRHHPGRDHRRAVRAHLPHPVRKTAGRGDLPHRQRDHPPSG